MILESFVKSRFEEFLFTLATGNTPENFPLLRHLALIGLNQKKTIQLGLANKRRRARWDNDYLLQALAG